MLLKSLQNLLPNIAQKFFQKLPLYITSKNCSQNRSQKLLPKNCFQKLLPKFAPIITPKFTPKNCSQKFFQKVLPKIALKNCSKNNFQNLLPKINSNIAHTIFHLLVIPGLELKLNKCIYKYKLYLSLHNMLTKRIS